MAERVTITIEPSETHGGQLTVQDAMRQVLDFIEVVAAAANDDARQKLEWQLVSATTNSPFTAVAEAVSVDPEWLDYDSAAKEAKAKAIAAFASISDSGAYPDWADGETRDHMKSLLVRNLNGIARTSMRFEEETPPVVLSERRARATIEKIDRAYFELVAAEPDLSGEEFGSVDANVLDAMRYRGRPALRVMNRLSEEKIVCTFPEELAAEIGSQHSWSEVWKGQRVLISGKIKRNVDGVITHVAAEDVHPIQPRPVRLGDIVDRGFTGGKGVREYLEEDWD